MNKYTKNIFLNLLDRAKQISSNKLAIDIQQGMLGKIKKRYKVKDGGVREAPFWVLVGALMPSVLIEMGYITNPTESDKLFNPVYQKLMVKGIANGIESFFVKNPN